MSGTDAAREQAAVARTRLELSLDAGGLGTWDWDPESKQMWWSSSLTRVLGMSSADVGGETDRMLAWVDDDDRQVLVDALEEARVDGTLHQVTFRWHRPDGELRWIEGRGQTVVDEEGRPVRLVGVAADITERQREEELKATLLEREHHARVEAEAARERLSFLASASAALNATLDARSTAVNLTRLMAPALCEWCTVDVLDEAGSLRQLALAHAQPDGLEVLQEARQRLGDGATRALWDVRQVVTDGQPVLLERLTDDDFRRVADDPAHLDLLRRLVPRSVIVVPLVARGRILGGLTVIRTGDAVEFDVDDLALVENVAARAAMAIDNARLFEERSRVARILQQALLPPSLPEIPGVEVSARYRTAESGIDIGGDFYDLFELPDGSWAVVIGDVSGKGTVAAAITGLVRHTIRAVAVGEDRPSSVLRRTNDVMLGQVEETRFCTAALLRLTLDDGRPSLAVSSGGHPRPYLVRADGHVEAIDCTGTLLGALPDPDLVDVDLGLGPGDAVVLYTDGVTEARQGREMFGDQGIAEVLTTCGGQPAGVIADRLTAAVSEYQQGVLADDTAVLVLRAATE